MSNSNNLSYRSNKGRKIFEHKNKIICVKVSCNHNKLDILRKSSSLKGMWIFINEDLILEDQVELKKEVQKFKEARKEGNGQSLGI